MVPGGIIFPTEHDAYEYHIPVPTQCEGYESLCYSAFFRSAHIAYRAAEIDPTPKIIADPTPSGIESSTSHIRNMTEPPEKKALSMPSVLLLMSRDDSVQILAFAAASPSLGKMIDANLCFCNYCIVTRKHLYLLGFLSKNNNHR